MNDRYLQWPNYPSVTEIIKAEGFMGWLPEDQYYLDRGAFVHEAIALYFKGTLDMESLAEGIKPFVDSAIEYITFTGYKPEHAELSLCSPMYKYCGTLDAWPLLDWKTGGKSHWHVLQMAAYFNLGMENIQDAPSHIPVNVHLSDKGKMPKCEPYKLIELMDAKRTFLSALNCYQWKKSKGVIK
jgi:hypothetical protein